MPSRKCVTWRLILTVRVSSWIVECARNLPISLPCQPARGEEGTWKVSGPKPARVSCRSPPGFGDCFLGWNPTSNSEGGEFYRYGGLGEGL